MKVVSISFLLVTDCSRTSEYSSSFTVNTTIPTGTKDARAEVWKVERMIESAQLHDLAFAHAPSLGTA